MRTPDYAASWGERRPHMPLPIIVTGTSSMSLDNLINPAHWAVKPDDDLYLDTSRLLGGYILPPFQRPLVWDEARMIAFIESAQLGLHLGTIIWNDAGEAMQDGKFHPTDRYLLDGQQRITALTAYVQDAFSVFAGTPYEHRWSDLNAIERRTFGQIQIGYSKVNTTDDALLRTIYDRLNFGGIPHSPDQSAVLQPGTSA